MTAHRNNQPVPPPQQTSSFWQLLRDAIQGTDQDFTEGSLTRALAVLAIPMVLEMSMESLFALTDAFFVARLGSEPLACVGLTESLLTLLYAVAEGLSVATVAVVSRRIGQKDPGAARHMLAQALMWALLAGIFLGAVGGLTARRLLQLMGADPGVWQRGTLYASVQLGSAPVILALFVLNAGLRGAGDAARAMRVLWLSNGLNICLDPCLIFGWGPFPELGLDGAAWATLIGRSSGVAYQLWVLLRGTGRITLRGSKLQLDWRAARLLLRLAGEAALQFVVVTASWLGLIRIVALFGSAAVAGYTVGIRVLVFVLLPSWGFANATATLVGQSLGAGQPERARAAVHLAGTYNMAFLGVVEILCLLFADEIVGFLAPEPHVARYAAECLTFFALGCLIYAWGMVLVQAFNGAGDTRTPMLIDFVCYWLLQLPLAYALAVLAGLGPPGVYIGSLVSEGAVALAAYGLFRRGRWQQVQA